MFNSPPTIIANPNDQVSEVELIVPKLVNKHRGVIEWTNVQNNIAKNLF